MSAGAADGSFDGVPRVVAEDSEGMDLRVLLVDDDPGIRRSYAKLLQSAGFSATAVPDALAAFEELKKQSFGAILLDIQMPKLTGSHLFEQLVEWLPRIARRVVFVSGFVDVPDTHEFLVKMRRPFLAKPIERDDLVAAVQRVMEGNAQEAGGAADGEPASSD